MSFSHRTSMVSDMASNLSSGANSIGTPRIRYSSMARLSLIAQALADDYDADLDKTKQLLKVWPLLKGLAEWRRDDPESHPTDLAELITALRKYQPNLVLSEEEDGYLADFIEAKNAEICIEKLLATMRVYDPFLSKLASRRGTVVSRSSKHQPSPSSRGSFGEENDFGLSILMEKLVQSSNCINHAVQRRDVERVEVEGEKLQALVENLTFQVEDATRFIVEARDKCKNDVHADERTRDIDGRHEERIHIMEKFVRESEDAVAALYEEQKDHLRRIQELTDELEREKEKGVAAEREFRTELGDFQKYEADNLKSVQKQMEAVKQHGAATVITANLRKLLSQKKVRNSMEAIRKLVVDGDELRAQLEVAEAARRQLLEENRLLQDQTHMREQLEAEVSDLRHYAQELQENAVVAELPGDSLHNLQDELAEMGEFSLDMTEVREEIKEFMQDTMIAVAVGVGAAQAHERIARALRDEEKGEIRDWLVTMLRGAGWTDKSTSEAIKWRLGVLYRCVRQSRRPALSSDLDSTNDDSNASDAGSENSIPGAVVQPIYRGFGHPFVHEVDSCS